MSWNRECTAGLRGLTPLHTAGRRFDLLAAGALVALALVFYSGVLGLWWTSDDFYHLRFVLAHQPFSYLYRPAVWRELPFKMITPLMFASFETDLSFFGLAPYGFYIHQLLVVGLLGAAFYLLLRMWLPRWPAWGAAFLLLAGVPLTASVGLIMVRHYLEGALPAVVSAALFVCAPRAGSRAARVALALLSASFYLLAALEKEIFVPLVLVLAVIPARAGEPAPDIRRSAWRERLRAVRPHLAALAAYVAYRVFMLGELMGGYGWVVRPRELPLRAVALPGRLLANLAGGQALGWATLVLLGAAALAGLALRRRALLPAAVGALVAVAPIVPVSTVINARYTLAAWMALVIAAASGWQALAASRGRAGPAIAATLGLAACCAAGWSARMGWERNLGELQRMSAENLFFVQAPAGALLRNPLGVGSSLAELRWWKEELFGLPRGTRWSYEDVLLCTGPVVRTGKEGVWSYDARSRRMIEVTTDLPRLCRESQAAVRPRAPLQARFEQTGGAQLFWRLGPYSEGKYSLLLAGGATVLAVPHDAGYRTRGLRSILLQVRYQSPAGWVTYSPAFDLDLSRPMVREWHRGG